MTRRVWDVAVFRGRSVYLLIVDQETGGWGHLTLDDVRAPTPEELAALPVDGSDPGMPSLAEAFRGRALSTLDATAAVSAEGLAARAGALRAALEGTSDLAELSRLEGEATELARSALLANPLVTAQPIVYVVRAQYLPDHHNTETMFQTDEINTGSFRGGGALRVLDPATGETRTLVEAPEGIARDPEVSFDGKRILFSLRWNAQDDYHIYEIDADGSNLRQRTFGRGVTDIDPLYMPDGRIVFTSTREPKYCMCNRHIMGNLFRMDSDGANIHQIGHSTLFEGHGALLPDGRVLYDRWEYVDRNFGDAQGLWTCNPDGTNHALYWGNNTAAPGGVIDARILPNGQQALAVLGSCHDRPWGALAILDRRLGMDGRAPVLRTWPADAIERVGQGNWDAFIPVSPKYEDPYPLSDDLFLCARQTGEGERMGLYVVDGRGAEALLHVEGLGCFDPVPLRPSVAPPVVPDRIDLEQATGSFYVADVYEGTGMERVEPGSVKRLRVVESPEKRFWTHTYWGGQGTEAPAMNWHDFNNKRILGSVPVAADGSAYFRAPADRFIYFQLLDERGRMIQSMRSGTIVRPGERAGCVGCHENRTDGAANALPEAALREPDALEPWLGPERDFSYQAEVQPVWDAKCLSCHDYGGTGAEKLVLAGDRTLAFCASYNELWRKGYVRVVGAGPAEIQPPLSWGAHASPIVAFLDGGHYDATLTEEEYARVVTWIDLNAPYYPTYASAYPANLYGRSPLTNAQLERLGALIGVSFLDGANDQAEEAFVSFARPELSPLLAGLSEPARSEALAILESGVEALRAVPRADMPGFALLGVDAERERKYERLAEEGRRALEAILSGAKYYSLRD